MLSQRGIWKVPNKVDQAAYSRNEDGSPTGFEDDPPFVYHDGYLSSHFASPNYQEINLTPLQEEAVWQAPLYSPAQYPSPMPHIQDLIDNTLSLAS